MSRARLLNVLLLVLVAAMAVGFVVLSIQSTGARGGVAQGPAWRINPAKALYILLYKPQHLIGPAILALVAAFVGAWRRKSAREALATAVLFAVSVAVLLVASEFLYRIYVIKVPQARNRALSAGGAHDTNGTVYSFSTMIRPTSDLGIVFELKPGLDGSFSDKPLKTNSRNMRGPEVSARKDPATLRVLGLGDSVMFGWAVSYEDTALVKLGQALERAAGKKVETINLGCPCYNTAQEVNIYRSRGRQYRPDLVVLIFLENDFGFPGLMIEPVRLSVWRRSYFREDLCRLLATHWPEAPPLKVSYVSTLQTESVRHKKKDALTSRERFYEEVQSFYSRMAGEDAVQGCLTQLGAMLREDHARGVVVYCPIKFAAGNPRTYEKSAGLVLSMAKTAGLEAIDMRVGYEEYLLSHGFRDMRSLWCTSTDWHPSAAGHELIAEALMKLVADKGWFGVAKAAPAAPVAAKGGRKG